MIGGGLGGFVVLRRNSTVLRRPSTVTVVLPTIKVTGDTGTRGPTSPITFPRLDLIPESELAQKRKKMRLEEIVATLWSLDED